MSTEGLTMPAADTNRSYFIERDALAAAFRDFLAEVLTEPLPLAKLCGLFDLNVKTMRGLLRRTDGVERHGRFWRVPLRSMPPTYFLETGILQPSRD
jgi:hypothetical protein